MMQAPRSTLLLPCVAILIVVVASALTFSGADAAFCGGKPGPPVPNTHPIYTAPPRFVRSVVNGTLYEAGQGDDTIWVAHVYGDYYTMGYAYGLLLKDEINEFIPRVWKHLEEQIDDSDFIKKLTLPSWLITLLTSGALDVALDAMWEATKPYTPAYIEQEMRGVADASGVDYKMARRIHLIGEITKGRCSMFGANKSATADGGLLQLRALDWDTSGPFQDFPSVTVYHPDPGHGYAWANIGWTGWIGSITGFSSNYLAISEIGVSFPDSTFGDETVFGIPFVYLLRAILQETYTLDDAISYMANAERTCHLILGVGDGKLGEFRAFEYSHTVLDVQDPLNMRPEADWHPRIPDVVYYGMDWLCPSYNQRLAEQITAAHGRINATLAVSDVIANTRSGDLHVALYDLAHHMVYIANARGTNESGTFEAFSRQYVRLDMDALFAQPRPKMPSTESESVVPLLRGQQP